MTTNVNVKSYAERLVQLEDSKDGIASDIRDLKSEADAAGVDKKVLADTVRLMRMDVEGLEVDSRGDCREERRRRRHARAQHRRRGRQRALTYIVISKPKRKSLAVGVVHCIRSLLKR